MVVFRPDLTEVIVFDLEAFVPPCDRKRKTGASLAVNPYREGHTLLGGVIYRARPLEDVVIADFEHHWIWRDGSEEKVVKHLFFIFSAAWEQGAPKKSVYCDPLRLGVGIYTFDLPFLATESQESQVATPVNIS